MKPLEKMSFSQNAQQIISYTFYILFAGYSIYKIIQAEFISTKILFIILLIIILGIALYSEYLKHLYRKAIKTIAYDLNPEKANEQFNELSKNKLAIFISHRMASTRFCDNIIVFKNGSIEEMGSHYELMKAHSVYWKLFNMQSKYYMNAESGKL